MPKIKTHSAAKKRFKRTGNGHFKHKQAHKSHLLTHESSKRKRKLRGNKVVHKSNEKQIAALLPYSG
jgi:large subunit ribosomal protein L35